MRGIKNKLKKFNSKYFNIMDRIYALFLEKNENEEIDLDKKLMILILYQIKKQILIIL